MMAEGSCVLQPMRDDNQQALGGGDIDCAVMNQDPMWALRLPQDWRLCQCLRYDLSARYWVVDVAGSWVALDVLEDDRGLNRLSLPTTLFTMSQAELAPASERAAYLAIKRVWKEMLDDASWKLIGELASEDPGRTRSILTSVFHDDLGERLADRILAGRAPDRALWGQARKSQRSRYLRDIPSMIALVRGHSARLFERLTRPTGFSILIAGPDGTGKSTLAKGLLTECARPMRKTRHIHWRPGLIPRPGELARRDKADPTHPHARPPHGRALSSGLLLYYWVDFLIGGLVRILPQRLRSGLVVIERGWWDVAVDPSRYRLNVPRAAPLMLGRLMSKPDVAFVLEGDSDILLARKAEISREEIDRQVAEWRKVLPPTVETVYVDATRPAEEVLAKCREEVVRLLERRAVARLGAGWSGLPNRGRPRWIIPRGPKHVARESLAVYHPVTLKGRLGWEVARRLSGFGLMRLLPRGVAPPTEVRDVLAQYVPPGGTMSVSRSTHPGRFVASVLDRTGRSVLIAKIATDIEGRRKLSRETDLMRSFEGLLPSPLCMPAVIGASEGCLLMQSLQWKARWGAWRLPVEVATSMGRLFRAGRSGDRGPTHGDFAPWNLLATEDGWALIDWEEASPDGEPFFDIFNYQFRAHALLGRPRFDDLVRGLQGEGQMGAALSAYAAAAGVPWGGLEERFLEYLDGESRGDSEEMRRASVRALGTLS